MLPRSYVTLPCSYVVLVPVLSPPLEPPLTFSSPYDQRSRPRSRSYVTLSRSYVATFPVLTPPGATPSHPPPHHLESVAHVYIHVATWRPHDDLTPLEPPPSLPPGECRLSCNAAAL